MTTIRVASADDVAQLVAMGERFLAAVYAGKIAGNRAALTGLAERLVAGPEATVYVAAQGATLVGMIGLLLFAHPMSGERTATEVMWWIEPQCRGVGLRLLRHGERWARAHGARRLQMIAPSADVERLYECLGYEPIERTYQRSLL